MEEINKDDVPTDELVEYDSVESTEVTNLSDIVSSFKYLTWDRSIWECHLRATGRQPPYTFYHYPEAGGEPHVGGIVHYWNNGVQWQAALGQRWASDGEFVTGFHHESRDGELHRNSQYIDFEAPHIRRLRRAILVSDRTSIIGFRVADLP